MTERRRRDLLTPLLFALTVILLLAFWVFRPFLLVFAVAACVALLLAPVQKRLARALGHRPTIAAALLVLVTTVVILVPVLTSLFLLARQVALFLDWIRVQPLLGPEELQRFWEQLPQRYPGLRAWISWLQAQVTPVVSGGIEQLAGGANSLLQNVLGKVTHAALDLGLFLLMLFFLLRDGGRLRAELQPISPFSEEQERQIFDHLERTIQGALQAVVVVPVVQGILAGIGFMMFGVPQPFVWGTAVILAATVPLVGSPLGWIPACLYLALKGQTGPALGLLAYSAVVVSGSDNVIKPMLLAGSARIHPLLGFLSIIGGVLAFGVFGFLIGPVILSLVLSAIRIYRLDVLRVVVAGAPASEPPSGDGSATGSAA
ncbi:MAG TPA: AI-2E family transporter [Vicinamibacteria bacterium]|nr:AI-2E family transporter [Vicinamibacteria bacterium]